MKERTPLLVGAGLLIVLLVVSLFAGSDGDIELLDEGTPEGTVQAYVQALIAGDREEADRFLAADIEDHCFQDEVEGYLEDARVALGRVDVDGADATVEVFITQIDDGALTLARSESEFELTNEDGEWLISAADWPFGCGLVRPLEDES